MKIAIAVHGRFEAFDLARELVRRGHKVRLLTNYPRWAVRRFGVPGECVRSFWLHGVLSRALNLGQHWIKRIARNEILNNSSWIVPHSAS